MLPVHVGFWPVGMLTLRPIIPGFRGIRMCGVCPDKVSGRSKTNPPVKVTWLNPAWAPLAQVMLGDSHSLNPASDGLSWDTSDGDASPGSSSLYNPPIFPPILLHKRSRTAPSADWPVESVKKTVDWLTSGLLRLTRTRDHRLITGVANPPLRYHPASLVQHTSPLHLHFTPALIQYKILNTKHMCGKEPSPSGADHHTFPGCRITPRWPWLKQASEPRACPALTVTKGLVSHCGQCWKPCHSGWHQGFVV